MSSLAGRVKRHRSAIVTGTMRAAMHAGLLLLFFGLMSVNNWPLLHPSRTLASTLLTYAAMAVAMNFVYGGYAVGKKKSKPVISAMSLGALLTDLVTYLQLQIMNVNDARNSALTLFGEDFPWLLLCIALQIVLISGWVRLGNFVYFRMNPPRKCLMVLGSMDDRAALEAKLGRYRLQWRATGAALWNDADLIDRMRQADVIFLCGLPPKEQMRILHTCYDLHRDVMCKAELEDIMLSNAKQSIVDDAPFLEMEYRKMTIGQRVMKRGMDMVVSGLSLLILSPLLGIIALAIYLEDRGSPIFKQKRMSVNGRVFTIYKFRTMRVAASSRKHQVSVETGDDRITRVGKLLRRVRLDELPQLWNILRGDMTLVGPRPEMLENVEKYKQELPAFVYREKMKAGLTGYAQIEGRYNTTPEDKLMLDLMYIESYSFWLDVKLLFRTLTVFFKSDSTAGFAREETPSQNHPSMRA